MGVKHKLEKLANSVFTEYGFHNSFIMRNCYLQPYVLKTHSWVEYFLNQRFLIQGLNDTLKFYLKPGA